MKLTLIFFVLLLWTNTIAQSISLPAYQQGQYENDTIYTYYGPFPFTGLGSVNLVGSLASGFITGVHFKIVVDSTNQGASPTHAAFWDSLGILVPVYQGDTLEIPASFQLFAGDIGFHIIIEGTPQIAGESYLCDLGYTFTSGNDWSMLITENTQDSCLVDQSSSLNENIENQKTKVYPNPFNQFTIIEIENYLKEPFDCRIVDLSGKEVRTFKNISSNKLIFEKDGLPAGTYIFQLHDKFKIIATGKLIIKP